MAATDNPRAPHGVAILALLFVGLPQCIESSLVNFTPNITQHTVRRRDVLDNKVYHKYEERDGACKDKDFRDNFMATMKDSTCDKPLDGIVKLESSDDNYEFIPSHVKVKRCHGGCTTALSCTPTVVNPVFINVRRRDRVTSQMTCGVVEVDEHVRCMCACSTSANHCNNLQEYHSNECACQCRNYMEKDKCQYAGRQWNMRTCTCDCPEPEVCSTGLVWVPSRCKCMRVL